MYQAQAEVAWNCGRCGITNSPTHRMCYSCKKWRDMDWPCVMCGYKNFFKREECKECGAGHVPQYTGPESQQVGGGAGSGVFRETEDQAGYSAVSYEGSYSYQGAPSSFETPPPAAAAAPAEIPWLCGMCNYENTPQRILCFECSGHRDRVEVRNRAAEMRLGMSPPPPPSPRPASLPPRARDLSRDVSRVQYRPGGIVEDQTLDWHCCNCNNRNFAKRKECYKCKKSRAEVEGAAPAPREVQYPRPRYVPEPREVQYPRPRYVPEPRVTPRYNYSLSYNTEPAERPEDKSKDWHCSNCSNRNFAKRKECYKCKKPREEVDDKSVKFYNDSPLLKRPPPDLMRSVKYGRPAPFMGSVRRNPPEKRKCVEEDRSKDWDCKNCNINNFAKKTSCFTCGKSRAECEATETDVVSQELGLNSSDNGNLA